MHNSSSSSSSSSAYSSTESWDFDPDLIIPDGPLTLLQSDNENETEDSSISSSIQSALFSSNGAHSTITTTTTTTTTDLNHSSSSQSVRPRTDDSEHDLHQLGCFESEDEDEDEDEDEERGDETGRGGTLRLKIIKPQQVQLFDCFKEPCLQQQLPHQKSSRTTINNTNLSLLISSSSRHEIDDSLDSISSHSSSERQSTIKASITPTPTLTSTASSSTHESSPSQTPPDQLSNLPFHSASSSSSSSSVLNPAVFTVLASGAKGTVTRLEPNKRSSPAQAGLDWDEDIVLPEGGLGAIIMKKQIIGLVPSTDLIRLKPDFPNAITDEFCNSGLESDSPQDHWAHHREKKMRPDHCLISHGGSIDQLTVNLKSQRMTSKCGTVTEENSRGVDDPVCDLLQEPLALSGQLTEKGKPIKEPSCCCSSSSSSISKPNSLVSLTGSDLDFLEDDEPAELKKRSSILSSSSSSSSSNQKRPTRLGRLPRSNSSSTSFSIFGNNNINDDSTPRIRTRPSLTPSLMSDRSSSPFTEAEDDINEGFFDDIEFPPEFGIPNNLHPASTPSNPSSSLPSSKLHEPTESVHSSSSESSRIVESKSKKYLELQRSVNLQTYLNMKVRARATMAERGSYSFPSDHYHLPKSSSTQSFVTAPSIPSSSSSTTIAAPSSGPRIQPPSSSSSSSSLSKLNQVSSQSHQFGNHPSSSNHFSSTIRRKFRAYEDRSDERVEDGLEIEINSINPDKLRSRTSSTLSSGSSLHPHSLNFPITRHGHLPRHQPQRSSLGNPSHAGFISSHQQGALHQQNKLKRMTVPFPSSTTNSTLSKTGESAVDKVPTNYKRSLSTRSSGSNIKSTSSSSSTGYSFPIVPHPAPHINRPTSTMTTSSSSRSIAVSIPHRPQSVATTSSTNSGRVKAAVSSNALSLAAPSPHSLKPPRLRTKSLKHTSSDPKIGDDHRPQSRLQHQASSSRVQSPSFGARGGGTREQSGLNAGSNSIQTGYRPRTLTSVARTAFSSGVTNSGSSKSTNGPPILLPSNQRTLKHKKSAAALNTNSSGNLIQNNFRTSNLNDRPSCGSPPCSNSSSNSNGRARLSRKQSMPLLNRDNHHHQLVGGSNGSNGGTNKYGNSNVSSSANGRRNPDWGRPKSRQQQHTESSLSPPSSFVNNSAATSSGPPYADPTQASINRQATSAVTPLSSISGSSDRVVVTRRKSKETTSGGTSSPVLTAPLLPLLNSRLTMPTIASRLKAKPSIIHEEQLKTGTGTGGIANRRWPTEVSIPQQLRRPRKLRSYGDGTELDDFDDLPTSKEREKMFTRVVKSNSSSVSKVLSGSKLVNPGERKETLFGAKSNGLGSRNRLEMRKAESIRRRNDATNGISKITTKKGLIRQMSMKTFSQAANNGEMRWNEEDVRWEGNEQVLREFDNVLSSSSRPALISQLSIQSPVIQSPGSEDFGGSEKGSTIRLNKAHNHVVGGMIFDSEAMCWRSREVDGEDELLLESDEELEMRWQADDEGSNTGGVGVDLAQSEWNDSGRLIDRGDDEVKQEGKFWDDCVEAEIRHLKEIKSWIPTKKSKSCIAKRQSKKDIDGGVMDWDDFEEEGEAFDAKIKKMKRNSHRTNGAGKGFSRHGSNSSNRLDLDGEDERFYLQEIRRLVLEDQ